MRDGRRFAAHAPLLRPLGVETIASASEKCGGFMAAETARWGKPIDAAQLKTSSAYTPGTHQEDDMARIPFATRDDIPMGERAAFDAFVATRGSAPSAGPYALLLHMPALAHRLETLRLLIRDERSLPQKTMELVMITVAREMNCAYIWYAHAAAARDAGVRGDVIDAIRERRALAGLAVDDQAAVDFTRELLRDRKVSQATFDRARGNFGQRGTMTLTNLIACYAMLAYNMNAYELEAPAHPTEPGLPID